MQCNIQQNYLQFEMNINNVLIMILEDYMIIIEHNLSKLYFQDHIHQMQIFVNIDKLMNIIIELVDQLMSHDKVMKIEMFYYIVHRIKSVQKERMLDNIVINQQCLDILILFAIQLQINVLNLQQKQLINMRFNLYNDPHITLRIINAPKGQNQLDLQL